MTSPQPPRVVEPAEVQEQIKKIVSSRTFIGKGQLIKLLRILSEHLNSITLKPDRVIRELWPDEVRTKDSADVATEINRLRKALDAYYADEGCGDPIIIRLPNRAPSTNGVKETRWMVAEQRTEPAIAPSQTAPEVRSPFPRKRNWLKVMSLSAFIVVVVFATFILSSLITRDRQPNAARLEGSTLVIVNEKGKELWRKSFSNGFWPQYYEQGVAQRVRFADLDGKGHTSVLFAYHPATSPHSHSSTLICYSDRGDEKWRWIPGRALPEVEGELPTFELTGFEVLKDAVRRSERVVVSSIHTVWSPSQVAVLDANGHLLSEYWHSGHFYHLTLADLDGDGRQEIILTGVSNGYHQATMVVLDSDRVNGASVEAARPEIQIHGMGIPHERARLLFPRTDLNFASEPWNESNESTAQNGKILVWTKEYPLNDGIWYEFDNRFRLLHIEAGDHFRSAHDEYYRKEKNAHIFGPEELKEFEKVRCLVGCPTDYVPVDIH